MRNKLLQRLWCVARERGMSSEELHAFVGSTCGKTSLKIVSDKEAYYILDVLNGKPARRPHGMASEAQIWKINELAKALGWENDPRRLHGFIKKYAKCDRPEWLTKRAAQGIIDGLKKMLERQGGI